MLLHGISGSSLEQRVDELNVSIISLDVAKEVGETRCKANEKVLGDGYQRHIRSSSLAAAVLMRATFAM